MRWSPASVLLLAALGAFGASRVGAQETAALDSVAEPATAAASAPRTGSHSWPRPASVGLRIATAHRSPFATRLGSTAHRDFYTIELHLAWPIAAGAVAALEYAPAVTPVAITTGNPEYSWSTACPADHDYCPPGVGRWVPSYHTVYGFGFAPLGFQLRLFPHAPVRLVAHISGGALLFTRPVPDPAATRFNFTAEAGGGIEIALSRHHDIAIGYAIHHTSNGGTGRVNPGMNARILTVGIRAVRE